MADDRGQRGQTLVELALVLPCFCLAIFMAVQLMTYCHNMLELQRMATVSIDRVSVQNYKSLRQYSWFHSLYGQVIPPINRFESRAPSAWVPFRGISTLKERGHIIRVSVRTRLVQRGGFTRVLPSLFQEARAEALVEPPIPGKIR